MQIPGSNIHYSAVKDVMVSVMLPSFAYATMASTTIWHAPAKGTFSKCRPWGEKGMGLPKCDVYFTVF